jgi:hypothetical protein
MTLAARLTAPLAPLDRRVNALNDLGRRVLPWAWWPARAPRRTEPYGLGHHVVAFGWALGAQLLSEAVTPAEARRTGARLQAERVFYVGLTLAATEVMIGAWDRRATALRRRLWRRLLG